jgi:hypothetical protein
MDKKEFVNECLDLLSPYFEECEKAEKWIYIKNPYFGEISPMQMFKLGKGQDVIEFIKSAKEFWDL